MEFGLALSVLLSTASMRHHSGPNVVGLTGRSRVSPQQILTTVMTRIVVDKSTDNAKPHLFFVMVIGLSGVQFSL